MSLIQFFGNLAFFLVACSFMVKDILWLRLLSVFASFCSMFYNAQITGDPLWVPIGWNILFTIVNFYHIVKIIYGNREILLNNNELELYKMSFSQLNLIEFSKLIRMGEWKNAPTETVLVNQGDILEDVLMIYSGRVQVFNLSKKVGELRDGQFIGEMSFLSNQPASATVKTVLPTEYISWNQKDLKELVTRNPALIFSLQAAMGAQLSMAIKEQNLVK